MLVILKNLTHFFIKIQNYNLIYINNSFAKFHHTNYTLSFVRQSLKGKPRKTNYYISSARSSVGAFATIALDEIISTPVEAISLTVSRLTFPLASTIAR